MRGLNESIKKGKFATIFKKKFQIILINLIKISDSSDKVLKMVSDDKKADV